MRDLLVKAQELCVLAEQKNKELDSLIEKNKFDASNHEAEARRLNEVKQDLAKREAAVSNIEDLAKFHNDAVILRGKADKEMADLIKERDAFNLLSEKKTSEIIAQEKAIASEWSAIKDARKKLDEGNKKLDEDKVKIKEAMKKLGI